MKGRMKGEAKLNNCSDMRNKHIGAKKDKINYERLYRYRSKLFDNEENSLNYRYHMCSCLAQTRKEFIGFKSANGSSPLERWGRQQGARRIPAIQARQSTLATKTAGQ
eukprot:1509331-Heterocapsa_arctica.AAC.1